MSGLNREGGLFTGRPDMGAHIASVTSAYSLSSDPYGNTLDFEGPVACNMGVLSWCYRFLGFSAERWRATHCW